MNSQVSYCIHMIIVVLIIVDRFICIPVILFALLGYI